jgi:hypothetical protein
VYTFLKLDLTDASRIKEVEELTGQSKFELHGRRMEGDPESSCIVCHFMNLQRMYDRTGQDRTGQDLRRLCKHEASSSLLENIGQKIVRGL